MPLLDDVSLPERAVRRLGILLVALGLCLPAAAMYFYAATWKPVDGVVETVGPLRPELVILPTGTFQMGSPEDEPGRFDNETLHQVTISQRFAISRTEITQGQYFAVMRERPVNERTDFADDRCADAEVGDDLPVVCVDWFEAVRFCNELSKQEGLQAVYTIEGSEVTWDEEAPGYRLPTEAEWEYAARAGTRHTYAGTSNESEVCDFGNVADASAKAKNPDWATFDCDDGFEALAPVGSRRPNRWQIYDMTGNAWEWVWDGYGLYSEEQDENPKESTDSSLRVHRGGSWWLDPRYARVALRSGDGPSRRNDALGFRVARSLPSTL